MLHPAPGQHAQAGVESDQPSSIDFFANWTEVPNNSPMENGFKAQWEMFLRHVAEDAPWPYGLEAGAKGRAAGNARPAELEGAALARRAGARHLMEIALPTADRTIARYRLVGTPVPLERRSASDFSRTAYAAAHVVADPLASNDPWLTPAIDWDATLAFRHRLWDLGFGVAEAMDTAQRGMGLGWPEAQELIGRALREARVAARGADRLRCRDRSSGRRRQHDARRRRRRL